MYSKILSQAVLFPYNYYVKCQTLVMKTSFEFFQKWHILVSISEKR